MAVKYDSSAVDGAVNTINDSTSTLNSDLKNNILSDFSSFQELGLFNNQLNTLKGLIDKLSNSQENLSTQLNTHKTQMSKTNDDVRAAISSYSSGSYTSSQKDKENVRKLAAIIEANNSKNSTEIDPGVSVSTDKVRKIVYRASDSATVTMLKKIYESDKEMSIIELLINQKKSGLLLARLKRILGDTKELDTTSDDDSTAIQRYILKRMNSGNIDINTEEGKSALEKEILNKVKTETTDEEEWRKLIHDSDKIEEISLLDEKWVVANTKLDIKSYESYVLNNGVRQNSDTSKYSDYCLAFSYVHAHDLYNGTKGTAEMAGQYSYAGEFDDYISDNKSKVLKKIYNEILDGKPVVLQVNGNTEGTSRHFVTVVGFKSSISDPSNLTEQDLLILDSWDGKLERMDTSYSRFMTTGAQCNKDYSGYRLRIIKD